MILRILFCLTLSFHSVAQYKTGKSKFFAQAEDSLSIIKKHLTYLATKDILTQEMKELGLDGSQFWAKYDKILEERLTPVQDQLKQKYKVDDPKQTRYQKNEYAKKWRLKKLQVERDLENIVETLDSYKVTQVTRSSQNPLIRFIKIEGKVNRNKLKRLYFNVLRHGSDRLIPNIFWSFNISYPEGDWEKLGVEEKSELTNALNQSFTKRIKEVLGDKIDEVIVVDSSLESRILSHFRMTEEELAVKKRDGSGSVLGNLWLRTDITIHSGEENKELERSSFLSSAKLSLYDLNYNVPVLIEDIDEKEYRLSSKVNNNKGSQVASHIFTQVSSKFAGLTSKIQLMPQDLFQSLITIHGVENILDVFKTQEVIKKEGIKLQLTTQLKSLEANSANLLVRFRGNNENLRKILLSLKGKALTDDKIIELNGEEEELSLRIALKGK